MKVILQFIGRYLFSKTDRNSLGYKLDFLFLAILVIFICFRPDFMHGEINFYESGIYLTGVNELFRGEIPYRDFFVLRGPLEIYFPALIMMIFGKHLLVFQAFYYFGNLITLIVGAFLNRLILRVRFFAYWATFVIAARWFSKFFWWNNWGGIRFGLGLMALLCNLLFLRKKRYIWIIASGLLSSLAFLMSFEIGLLCWLSAIGVFTYYFLAGKRDEALVYKKGFFAYLISAISVILPFFIYFLRSGILMSYVDSIMVVLRNMVSVFDLPTAYGNPKNLFEFFASLVPGAPFFKFIRPVFLYTFFLFYFLIRFIKRSINNKDLLIFGVFVYGVLMYISAFRAIQGPHYLVVLQTVLLLACVILEWIYLRFIDIRKSSVIVEGKRSLRKGFVWLSIGAILVLSLYEIFPGTSFLRKQSFIIRWITRNEREELVKLETERARGIRVPAYQAEEVDGVCEYLLSKTSKDEAIFAFPDIGLYNFLLDRPLLGRFGIAIFSVMRPEFKIELLSELKTKRPAYIIYSSRLSLLAQVLQRKQEFFQEAIDWIKTDYTEEITFGKVHIYKRKQL